MLEIANRARKTTPRTNARPAIMLRPLVIHVNHPPGVLLRISSRSTWSIALRRAHWLVSMEANMAVMLRAKNSHAANRSHVVPACGVGTTSFMNVREIASVPPESVITALSYASEALWSAWTRNFRYRSIEGSTLLASSWLDPAESCAVIADGYYTRCGPPRSAFAYRRRASLTERFSSFPNVAHAWNVLKVGVLRPECGVVRLRSRQHHAVRHGQLQS